MERKLNPNWQHILANSLLRGEWMIHPKFTVGNKDLIEKLINPTPTAEYAMIERQPYAASFSNGLNSPQPLNEANKPAPGAVAIFPIQGTMLKAGTMCAYGTEEIEAFMTEAAASDKIIGAVLLIDSPGGEVASVAPIHRGIKAFRDAGKPIVSVADSCMSAAYYAAIHTDYIFAENDISSEFGSIGVMMDFWDTTPLLEAEGYIHHRIKAPESNAKNKAFELALKGDYSLIQNETLSPLARKFQNDVRAARAERLDTEAEGILNGKTYFARDAAKLGLIDGFCSLDKAVKLVIELA